MIVLAANILVVGFAFMYNDVEDAPDDALDERKARRNPISAGIISPRMGRAACIAVSALLLGLYGVLGFMPVMLGGLCLALAFLYSWRVARLSRTGGRPDLTQPVVGRTTVPVRVLHV
ncbi:MAG: UbiA family prenyltransferase [Chloroflexi bacterium]|nr:UbiA family prenyltransferase [Chloroflexota bacterium]